MAVFLHTRVRVSDLDKSINWYCQHLGFVGQSRSDKSPAGNQIAHLELPGNIHTLELTYSPDYELNVPEGLNALRHRCARPRPLAVTLWRKLASRFGPTDGVHSSHPGA